MGDSDSVELCELGTRLVQRTMPKTSRHNEPREMGLFRTGSEHHSLNPSFYEGMDQAAVKFYDFEYMIDVMFLLSLLEQQLL